MYLWSNVFLFTFFGWHRSFSQRFLNPSTLAEPISEFVSVLISFSRWFRRYAAETKRLNGVRACSTVGV